MKTIIALVLMTFSSASLAVEFVSRIQSVLPFGYYQGENCSVTIGSGFANEGVGLSLNHTVNGNYFSESMSLYENSPWTEVLKDNSDEVSIDIKVKDNRGVIQRLIILDRMVTIQKYNGRRLSYVRSCLLIN